MDREFHRLFWGLALLAGICCPSLEARAQVGAPPPEPAVDEDDSDQPLVAASPLAGEPKTAEDLFEATVLMVDIARVDLAAVYFDKLLSLDLDDDALVALRDRFGAAPFLRLTRVKELQTAAEKLLDRSNGALARHAVDPQRLVRLLQLLQGDAEEQAAGRDELRSLGSLVVPGLIAIRADDAAKQHHDSVLATLVQVGEPAIPMLLGAMQAPDDLFRSDIITVLGHIRSAQAAPYLWYSALSPAETPASRAAARMALSRIYRVPEVGVEQIAGSGTAAKLAALAAEHYKHAYPWPTDAAGKVTLWTWSPDQKAVVPSQHSPEEASDITGLQFARQALALAPEVRKVQVLYLSLALTSEIRRTGYDHPLPTGPGTAHDLALSVGPDVAGDVLAESIASSRPMTAVAALKVLAQVGNKTQLVKVGSKRPPILAALDYPDPRVQFAAATTILQLDPPAGFPGATRVVEVLKRAAASGTRPHAVVGEVSGERAARIGGFLRDLGYEPLVYLTGREAFQAAADRSDVELIVLHPNMIRWALSETLANLRADSRTAGIPIVIHGPGTLEPRMRSHLRNYKLVSFASQAEITNDFEQQVEPFIRQIKTAPMNDADRASLREAAVAWLAHIVEGRRNKVFDIADAQAVLIDALSDPKLAPAALEALGEIPSQSVQRRLADLVLDPRAENDLRRAGALKLAFHLQRFGLLLSSESIAALHAAWKDARQSDELRTALGSVIGSLKPDDALVGKRLQSFPEVE
jgi:CheY-like chemotaxis protein